MHNSSKSWIKMKPSSDDSSLRLEEVRRAEEREWENNREIGSKATSIIQFSGTILGIIFGFLTFAESVMKLSFSLEAQILVVTSIIMNVVSIILCVFISSKGKYIFPVETTYYFRDGSGGLIKDERGNRKFNKDRIREHVSEQSLFMGYLNVIDQNRIVSDRMMTLLKTSSICLSISVVFLISAIMISIGLSFFGSQIVNKINLGEDLRCTELSTGPTRIVNNSILTTLEGPKTMLMLCMNNP